MKLFKENRPVWWAVIVVIVTVWFAPAAFAGTATAYSTVSITKAPALLVGHVSTDDLFLDRLGDPAQSEICLETAGQVFPYRLSAAMRKTTFSTSQVSVQSSTQDSDISSYQLYWSDGDHRERITHNTAIGSNVLHAQSGHKCDSKTLSVQRSNRGGATASNPQLDTLVLTFVIE